jgi:transcriptional regulator, tetR family
MSGLLIRDEVSGGAAGEGVRERLLRRVERLYSILAVRSRSSTPESDLTAVARIRNAALLRFARDGFGVGLRTIAADAGVTAGLITHHFGSKDGLRRACDTEVLRLTEEVKRSSTYFGGPTDLMTQMSQVEEYIPATAYAMRSLMEGGELATTLMDLFVADTVSYMSDAVKAGTVTPSHNEEARARYLLYAGFGALLLFLRYEASEPGDIEAAVREFIDRYGPVTAELYSRPLFTDPGLYADYVRATSADPADASADGAVSAASADDAEPAPAPDPAPDSATRNSSHGPSRDPNSSPSHSSQEDS